MALTPGATHTLQWPAERAATVATRKQIAKAGLSADWGLQLAPMKAELLVTACQQSAVNTYPGLVHTARHVMGVGKT